MRLRPFLAGVTGASVLIAGEAFDLAEAFLVGRGVAGGLDSCVVSDLMLGLVSDAAALVAEDLVVRAMLEL